MMNQEKNRNPRKDRTGLRRGIALAAGLLFLIGVNIGITRMEKKFGWRRDYSFNGITTQSEITRAVIAELNTPVHIYALFSRGQEDAPLMELLDRYASSSGLITWEKADPSLNPALLTRFSQGTESVGSDSLIVWCPETDRWQVLSPADFISLGMEEETGSYSYAGYTYERAITGALVHVTRAEIPRIVIVQGHGELDGDTLRAFDRLMTENHYEVTYQRLDDPEYCPAAGELLAFFSPMRDLSETEMEKLTAFAEQGGSFLFTCDFSDPIGEMPRYAALLRSYGFLPKEGIVVAGREEPGTYYNNARIDLIPRMLSTSVTMDLLASGADTVLMPGCRAFETPEGTDRYLMVFPVLESGETSYLKKVNSEMTSVEKEEGEEEGPFTLALQAQRTTGGGYVSRAFITGCSGMMTEEQIYSMTDLPQMMIRMIEYLTGQAGSNLEIMARSAVREGISARGNVLGSVIVTLLPLGILAAGLIVLIRRKNL